MRRYRVFYDNIQSGGAVVPEVFHIYTTGIVNWGNNLNREDRHNLIRSWVVSTRNNMIERVPSNFRISIHHYDPLYGDSNKPIGEPDRTRIITQVNDDLVEQDRQHPRVVNVEFLDQPLNLEVLKQIQRPHLIVDLAHIFLYPPIPFTVSIGGHYGEATSENMQINSLRFGYLGDSISFALSTSDIVRIGEDGNVETWIDRMITTGRVPEDYSPNYPDDIINKTNDRIIRGIEDKTKELLGGIFLYRIENILSAIKPPINEIIRKIMDKFWNNKPFDNIINEIVQEVIEEKADTIFSMEPLPE